jgi:chromosomal replication initiation ATPase DnaA
MLSMLTRPPFASAAADSGDNNGAKSCRLDRRFAPATAGVPSRCVRPPVGRSRFAAVSGERADSPRQLVLALDHRQSFDRAEFLPGRGNAAALELIDRWPDWPSHAVALSGPEGAGKSHLAAIWARVAGARTISARALSATAVPQALSAGALVIEDAGETGLDEAALFHQLNLAKEQQAWVLMTARSPPASWSISLADLGSRLRALPVVTLAAPDDAMLRAVLVKQFADRQLAVDDTLIRYLVERIERSYAAARRAVAELDDAALRLKRPVNRVLAGEILGRRAP